KIEIGGVIHVVEIRALSAGVDFVETDDALGLNQRPVQMLLVEFVILAQPRGDDLFQIESHQAERFRDLGRERKCSRPALSGLLRTATERRSYKQKSRRFKMESAAFEFCRGGCLSRNCAWGHAPLQL